jgi:hypothetical protein
MPDSKITALTSIGASTDPANDPLVLVDVSDTSMAASGTTKKVTLNQLLGAGGTATLASATITGDLTVGNTTNANVIFNGVTNVLNIGFGSLRGGSTYGDVRLWTDRFRIYNNAGTQIIKNISGTNGDETWYDGAGSTRMTLNSTGLGVGVTPSAGRGAIQLSAGVGFPATQVASSDANTLDDYEEGTFTPTVTGTTTAGVGTYSNQTGYYTKVGRLVTITVYMNWTAHTGTGNMRFSNLPFTSANLATNYNGINIAFLGGIALTAGNVLYGNIEFGSTFITATQNPTGGGAYTLVPIDTSAEIAFSATYFV